MSRFNAVVVGVLGLAAALTLAGCETQAQTNALVGGGLGAAAGQAIGGNTEGTLIGAGVGAGAGYIIGNEQDKAKAARDRDAANTRTVYVQNSNGSTTPVTLRYAGGRWIGPRGEEYPTLPSESQLRAMYGS